jgi:hypothetical protein
MSIPLREGMLKLTHHLCLLPALTAAPGQCLEGPERNPLPPPPAPWRPQLQGKLPLQWWQAYVKKLPGAPPPTNKVPVSLASNPCPWMRNLINPYPSGSKSAAGCLTPAATAHSTRLLCGDGRLCWAPGNAPPAHLPSSQSQPAQA